MLEALKKLGYRKMRKGVYGKPVGYHLFTVEKKKSKWEWTSWFKGNGKIHNYESHIVADEHELKTAEAGTKMVLNGWDSDFGFITAEEQFADML